MHVCSDQCDMKNEIAFWLNGDPVTLKIDASAPLLFVLREEFGLTGTRFGCGAESCGACTVLVDGRPAYACTREAGSLDGCSIRTVESLGDTTALHPLQQAFIEEQAGQCGYCLSGILMSALALLETNPDPQPGEIAAALNGHLCRCGVYNRFVRAVRKAAITMQASEVHGNARFDTKKSC